MKILVLTSAYPKFDGDATAPFMASITEHIAAQGHTVHVVLPEHCEWERPPVEGRIHFHHYRYSPRKSWTPWGYAQSLEAGVKLRRQLYAFAPSVLVSARRACYALAKRETFDVVHAHWVIPNGAIASGVSTRIGVPLVITLHGSDISVSERKRWIGTIARRTFARAAAITAPSEDLLDRAQRLGAAGDLELVPWGADPDVFQPDAASAGRVRERYRLPADDVMVLGIGRFVHWKGFDYLLEAVARAREGGARVRLVLVGDGDLRDDLVRRATSLSVLDHTTFAGMLPRDEVAAHLAAADIVAIPSVHYDGFVDGQPTVALEAMAAGKPLIVTRVGGLPQLVQSGVNGLVIEERDVDALAGAIDTLAGDPELRRMMGEQGRERILRERNWVAVADQLVAVFERVRHG